MVMSLRPAWVLLAREGMYSKIVDWETAGAAMGLADAKVLINNFISIEILCVIRFSATHKTIRKTNSIESRNRDRQALKEAENHVLARPDKLFCNLRPSVDIIEPRLVEDLHDCAVRL